MTARLIGMTRLLGLGLIAGCLLAIPLSHSVTWAKKGDGPPEKVKICHFPDGKTEGHVIEISENAVDAHISKHGDCTTFETDDSGACTCTPPA
jgi:hypothetical protein